MIEIETLIDRAAAKKIRGTGWSQIGCAVVEGVNEITYSFEDRDHRFTNLRIVVAPGGSLPSITPVYWGAFVYENEIHDLYGLTVMGINVDYGGHFYATKVPFPFAAPPAAAPAPARDSEEK